ncbi:MAG: response regulator [Planctomycetes bacterium]|nr:response regulator [Planctomycetota bacterium]
MESARILVVEDEGVVALDLQQRLQRMGHTVAGHASDGREAVALAARLGPDLILMDIRLDGAPDGIEAAEAIRTGSCVPIVYLTALSDQATLDRAKTTAPEAFVLKPIRDRELQITIEMVLNRHRMEAEKQRLTREIREAQAQVKMLRGLLKICARCKRIRDDAGAWVLVETYIERHSEASFTHGYCPDCADAVRRDWSLNPARRPSGKGPAAPVEPPAPPPIAPGGAPPPPGKPPDPA